MPPIALCLRLVQPQADFVSSTSASRRSTCTNPTSTSTDLSLLILRFRSSQVSTAAVSRPCSSHSSLTRAICRVVKL